MGRDRESVARNPAVAQSPDKTTNIVNLLDDEGPSPNPTERPSRNGQANQAAVSPDGSRLAVVWMDPKQLGLHAVRPGSRANRRRPLPRTSVTPGTLVFSPDGTRIATAGEDGLTRLWDTSTGTMTAQCRGHARKVLSVAFRPDGRRARDDLGGWDRPPVGFLDGPGGRVALRSSHRGSRDGGVQPRRTVDRLRRHGPDRPGLESGEPARRRGPAGPHRCRQRSGIHRGRPPAGFGESVGKAPATRAMARCGSGRSAARRARPCCAATPATSIRWRSARTDNGSPRVAGTTPYACGTQ